MTRLVSTCIVFFDNKFRSFWIISSLLIAAIENKDFHVGSIFS